MASMSAHLLELLLLFRRKDRLHLRPLVLSDLLHLLWLLLGRQSRVGAKRLHLLPRRLEDRFHLRLLFGGQVQGLETSPTFESRVTPLVLAMHLLHLGQDKGRHSAFKGG